MFDSIIKWAVAGMSVIGAGAGTTAFIKGCKTNKRVSNIEEDVKYISSDVKVLNIKVLNSMIDALKPLKTEEPVVEAKASEPVEDA